MSKDKNFNFWDSKQVKYETTQQQKIDTIYQKLGYNIDRSKACKSFDLTLDDGFMIQTYEEKFRSKNTEKYKDFGIEILQDVVSNNLGWFYTTSAEYIVQIHQDEDINNCMYIVNWTMFKNWFKLNYEKIQTQLQQCKNGFGYTLNIYIKWQDIPQEIYYKELI